jgi:hypothetical protein
MKTHPFWDKRIPTVFALFLLVIGVGVTTFLVQTGVRLAGFASPTNEPQNIRITNITDVSFTLTYTTQAASIGTIAVGKTQDALTQIAFDDRDSATGIPKPYRTHSITVRNLNPETTYYYSITSGADTFLNNNEPFTIKTAPSITAAPLNQDPISGKINNAGANTLVYVTSDTGQTLSTLAKESGLFIIPLNTFRAQNLGSYASLSASTTLQLYITDAVNESRVNLSSASRNPMPLTTIGNNYDFTLSPQAIAATNSAALSSAFPSFALEKNVSATIRIIRPSPGESFTDQRPQFRGTALPNSSVAISIHSEQVIESTVTADAGGNWTFRPQESIAPGDHTLTVTTKDQFNILQTLTRPFTVFAQGTQVSQSATPSATRTPSPTPAPSLTPTPTLTQQNGSSPAASLSPTPMVTITKGGLPPTGNESMVAVGVIGALSTLAGIAIFLATRTIPL